MRMGEGVINIVWKRLPPQIETSIGGVGNSTLWATSKTPILPIEFFISNKTKMKAEHLIKQWNNYKKDLDKKNKRDGDIVKDKNRKTFKKWWADRSGRDSSSVRIIQFEEKIADIEGLVDYLNNKNKEDIKKRNK